MIINNNKSIITMFSSSSIRLKVIGHTLISRSLAVTGRHSKNVAGKKNKLDAIKQKLYNRLAVRIFMAAKQGFLSSLSTLILLSLLYIWLGTDASVNKELSRALKEAKDNKLPKENIERAISKAQGKEASDITSGIYEGIN